MSKENKNLPGYRRSQLPSIEFHYGDKNFDELMEKIILEKVVYYNIRKKNKISCSNDNSKAAIYSKEQD